MARRNQISDTLECVRRGPKRGRTVAAVSALTGLHPLTVRRHISRLVEDGLVVAGGVYHDGGRGRPSTVFFPAEAS